MVSFVIFAEHITNLMIELDYQLLNSADASFNPTSGNINQIHEAFKNLQHFHDNIEILKSLKEKNLIANGQ